MSYKKGILGITLITITMGFLKIYTISENHLHSLMKSGKPHNIPVGMNTPLLSEGKFSGQPIC